MPIFPRTTKTETQWNRGNLSPPFADANSDMRLRERVCLPRRQIGVGERRKIFSPRGENHVFIPLLLAHFPSPYPNPSKDDESKIAK